MVDLVAWTVLRVKDDVLDADPRVSKVAVPSATPGVLKQVGFKTVCSMDTKPVCQNREGRS